MNDKDRERLMIRDAMERLLAGDPAYSDGKLTVKSLAVEARLDRSRLTQVHTDLKDEFYARRDAQGSVPEAMSTLMEENATLKQRHEEDRAEVRQAAADMARIACVVQVLALENAQLEERVSGGAPKVQSIRGARHNTQPWRQ